MTFNHGAVRSLLLSKVQASPFQVRKNYGDVEGLAEDMGKHGLLQPILVRPIAGAYEIVHGHRRWTAAKRLGWTHIQCFVKELEDAEAIVIQGCENIHRKDYDPIEEALLYVNYRRFMEEDSRKVSADEIAATFNSSASNIKDKIGLLELPDAVQAKIIEGTIPVGKALALISLTREGLDDASSSGYDRRERRKSRTDRFYSEIGVLAEEIEKGPDGGLRTRKGVTDAVRLIKEGKTPEAALEKAKLNESIERAKKQATSGKPPEEIIREILESQVDPQIVVDTMEQLVIKNVRKLLDTGVMKCPYCGESHLEWACVHKRI